MASNRSNWFAIAFAVGLAALASDLVAQQGDGRGPGPQRGAGQRDSAGPRDAQPRPAMDRQRRAALMEYVKKYNPPAARLLTSLEARSPGQYRQALQALDREVENLRAVEVRDPERFELALGLWRNRTKIDIALAQLARGDDNPGLREQLLQLLDEQRTARREILNLELAALAQRETRIREQLAQMENVSDEARHRAVDDMIRRAKLNAQRRPRGGPTDAEPPNVRRPQRDGGEGSN